MGVKLPLVIVTTFITITLLIQISLTQAIGLHGESVFEFGFLTHCF
jgi:hypothetical protein